MEAAKGLFEVDTCLPRGLNVAEFRNIPHINHIMDPYLIQALFLNQAILGSLGVQVPR